MRKHITAPLHIHYIKPKLAANEIYFPDSLYVQNELSSPSASFSLVASCS